MDLGLAGARALVGGGSGGLGGAIAAALVGGGRTGRTDRATIGPARRCGGTAGRRGGTRRPVHGRGTGRGRRGGRRVARRAGPARGQQRRPAPGTIRGPRRGGLAAGHRRHALERGPGHPGRAAAPPGERPAGDPGRALVIGAGTDRGADHLEPHPAGAGRPASSRWCRRSRRSASTASRRAGSRPPASPRSTTPRPPRPGRRWRRSRPGVVGSHPAGSLRRSRRSSGRVGAFLLSPAASYVTGRDRAGRWRHGQGPALIEVPRGSTSWRRRAAVQPRSRGRDPGR